MLRISCLTGDAPFFGTQAAYQTKFAPKGGDAQ